MVTELTDPNKKNISDDQKAAIKTALTRYYRGECTLTEALTQEAGISKPWYYELRKSHPQDIEELDLEARREAIQEKAGTQLHLESQMIQHSLAAQRIAAEAMVKALPEIAKIAAGESRKVQVTDKNGDPYDKTIASYPRDMIGAAKLLQEIARGGTLPEVASVFSAAEDSSSGAPDPTVLLAPPRVDFNKLEATAVDGTKVTVERGDVVDAEISEG